MLHTLSGGPLQNGVSNYYFAGSGYTLSPNTSYFIVTDRGTNQLPSIVIAYDGWNNFATRTAEGWSVPDTVMSREGRNGEFVFPSGLNRYYMQIQLFEAPQEVEIIAPDPAFEGVGTTSSSARYFTVELNRSNHETIMVDYAVGGTATEGTDYSTFPSNKTLTFMPGETSKRLEFTHMDDITAEPNETITLTLSNPTNTDLGTASATTTIVDDDIGAVSLTSTRQVLTEGTYADAVYDPDHSEDMAAEAVRLTATLDKPYAEEVTIDYDFTAGSATARPAGAALNASHDFSVWMDDDGDGELDSGEDAPEGTFVFAIGETSKIVEVRVYGDDVYEPTETIAVALGFPSVAGIGVEGNGETPAETIRVLNDDIIRTISVTAAEPENEGSTRSVDAFTVSMNRTSSSEVQVDYAFGGTATGQFGMAAVAGADFSRVDDSSESGTLVFAPGQRDIAVPIRLLGDADAEPDETVTLTLTNPRYGDGSGGGGFSISKVQEAAVFTILDDDNYIPTPPAGPQFSIDSPSVKEGDFGDSTVMIFTITRSGGAAGAASVDYSGPGGDASDADRTPFSGGTLEFTDGETEKTIEVTVLGDTWPESENTIEITLSNPTGAGIETAVGIGRILDDDFLHISVESDGVDEGASGSASDLVFTVSLGARFDEGEVSVGYRLEAGTATEGEDYARPAMPRGRLVWAARDTEDKTVTVSVIGDGDSETDEDVVMTLFGPVCEECVTSRIAQPELTVASARGVIRNDDAPTFSVNRPVVEEGAEGEASTMAFTVTVSPAQMENVTVDYAISGGTASGEATEGEDYRIGPSGASGTLTFAGGSGGGTSETEKTISVTVLGDDYDEADEEVTLTLSSSSPNVPILQAAWQGVIVDDDSPPVFSIDSPSVTEGDTGVAELNFTVSKTGKSRRPTSVAYSVADGTATSGEGSGFDYAPVADGRVTFAADQAERTITVLVNGDDITEADETVTAAISDPVNGFIDSGAAEGTGTIYNDDQIRTISVIAAESANEGITRSVDAFTVSMDRASSREVRVDYSFGGTATGQYGTTAVDGADFSRADDTSNIGTLTFMPDQQSIAVSIQLLGDTDAEPDETVTLTLSNPRYGDGTSSALSIPKPLEAAVFTILDDDNYAPTPLTGAQFSIDSPSVMEGDPVGTTTMTFTVTRSGDGVGSASVDYSGPGGSASNSDRASFSGGRLEFADGDTVKTIDVTVSTDRWPEPDETVEITLSNATGAGIETAVGVGTILNDDFLDISVASDGVDEGDSGTTSDLVFTVSLGAQYNGGRIFVRYRLEAGTATEGEDFVRPAMSHGRLYWDSGTADDKTVTVTVNGDDMAERNEDVVMTLFGQVCDNCIRDRIVQPQLAVASARGVIRNDDPPTFTVDAASANEGATGETPTLDFMVTMTPAWDAEVTVNYEVTGGTADGEAEAGVDFTAASGTLTFRPGETDKTIPVTLIGDDADEPNEELTLTLSNPSANAQITRADWMGTIVNDDSMPVFSVDSPRIVEGASGTASLVFTVTKTGATQRETSVSYTVGGTATAGTGPDSDYLPVANSTLAFARNETEKEITVHVNGDDLAESDETVTVTLSSPVLATLDPAATAGTGTIVNDDHLRVSLSIDAAEVNEGAAGTTATLRFLATLPARSSQEITVGFSIGGTATGTGSAPDYTVAPSPGTLTFAANTAASAAAPQTLPIVVTVNGDGNSEPDETVVVTLSNPACTGCAIVPEVAAGSGSATVTILNDDSPTFAVNAATVGEGASGETPTLEFMVTMTLPWHEPVTVDYVVAGGMGAGEATVGEDFLAASGTLTFSPASGGSAAELEKTVSVTVVGDDFDEEDETVTLTLMNSSPNAQITQAAWTGTIVDDDSRPVLSIDSPEVVEGATGTVTLMFTVVKTGGTRLDTTVDFAVTGGTATGGTGLDSDYAPVTAGTLTFVPDDTEQTVEVQVNGDDLAEDDETVTIALSSPVLATLDPAATEGTGTIVNDDHLTLSIDSPSVAEGNSGTTPLEFTVTLAARSIRTVTVDYQVITDAENARSGTATFGAAADYIVAAPTGTLTFAADTAAGQPQSIVLSVQGDAESEPDETVVVRLYGITGDAVFEGDSAASEIFGTGTILTDDSPIFAVIPQQGFAEGDSGTSQMTFTVTISRPDAEEVTVEYAVTGGTATAGEDYRAASGTLTFAAASGGGTGDTSKEVQVVVNGDREREPDETITLTLSNASSNALITQAVWTGTILSDDYGLTAAASPESVAEPVSGSTAGIAFAVTLDEVWNRPVELAYALGGSATEGADYSIASQTAGRLVIPAGGSTGTVSLAVNADIVDEDEETVAFEVRNLAGRSLADPAVARITRPESAPGVEMEPDARIAAESLNTREADGVMTASVRVRVTGNRSAAASFDWRITRIVDDEGTGSVSERGSGALSPRAMVEVLADSMAGANQRASVAVGESSAMIEATLNSPIASGDVIGFEIFSLDCASDVCEVVQSARARSRASQLSPGSMPTTTVLAEVFANQNAQRTEALTHALAGFGRAVATGIVNGIWRRADAHRAGDFSSSAVVGGRSLDTAVVSNGDSGQAAQEIAEFLTGAEFARPPLPHAHDEGSALRSVSGNLDDWRSRAGLSHGKDLAENSLIALSLDGDASGRTMTLWAEGSVSSFGSEPEEGITVDGGATVMLAGIDWTRGNLLMGIAMTSSQGDSDYTLSGSGSARESGSMEASLTGAAPYLHWMGEEGLGIWASAGTGSGELELITANGMTATDIGLTMLAVGAKKSLQGNDGLALRGDLLTVQTSADETDGFEELDAGAARARLALERGSRRRLDGGGSLARHLELGARLDSGDGGSGAGADVAGEFRYASADGGLEVAGRAGLLLLHSGSGFSEWNAGLEAAYAPGRGGRGLRLSLEPRWNVQRTGAAESLWSGAAPGLDADAGGTAEAGASLRARVGYGVGAFGDLALASPYSEAEAGDGERRLQIGVELRGVSASLERLSVDLYGESDETSRDVERRAMLEARLGF